VLEAVLLGTAAECWSPVAPGVECHVFPAGGSRWRDTVRRLGRATATAIADQLGAGIFDVLAALEELRNREAIRAVEIRNRFRGWEAA
jgi:hypothetical protein